MFKSNLFTTASVTALSTLSVCLGFTHSAQALSFTEVDDAGELLGTAQVIGGSGAITEISGNTDFDANDFADLFKISLDGSFFSATTETTSTDFDTALFLFDSTGDVVLSNDDIDFDNFVVESEISGNLAAGIYYLGITGSGYLPEDAFGSVINDPTDPPFGFDSVGTLAGWQDEPFEVGAYNISLTGVNAVPTPAAVLPILSGLFTAARRKKNK
ncbi:hypothetical protein Lepto7376_1205 [[Leptolyngbya] sp. PCC 7376]|uniref:PTPA-CTERM sorting domain-containing protein n=1 Tax=[Leptolyngbya] sp. PCC 7376 TaxID=111781 RepID=UPI00029F281E|nr:PTPA-CTERM sorting domain-containing protein [[Leptolyngbya] sp. PCC 7376]AFY37562.1 hypothetical protein Lepto7376_1205 [[Leptolyngbya] sp. PCC 7376]